MNGFYINDILKGELGFKGFVVSDWQVKSIALIKPTKYQ
jgi:beta-glucosidase-like glycosyl hydrolase